MSYRMFNAFCAAAGDLEEERQAFYRAVAECNQDEAMRYGALYVPLSVLPTVSDKTRIQHAVDYNIRLTHFYILVLHDTWGTPLKNFEGDYRTAVACREDPGLPMQEVAVLLKSGAEAFQRAVAWQQDTTIVEFGGAEGFQTQVRALLSRWLGEGDNGPHPIAVPAIAVEDEAAFVKRLVMETVMEELGAADWPESLRRPLLETQYQARMKGLRENFPDAEQEILRVNGEAVGWVVIARRKDEIRLVDIAIVRAHRGKEIGTARIRRLLNDGYAAGTPVRLSVGVMNPAVRLYKRLGFRRTGGDAVRYFMERLPGPG